MVSPKRRAGVGMGMLQESKRLFLRVGDEVSHKAYLEWGVGVVVEEFTSRLPGGTCLVRIRFEDGSLRVFNNDLDNEMCCYYFGVRKLFHLSLDGRGGSMRMGGSSRRLRAK